MKKKYRDIIVNGEKYAWSYVPSRAAIKIWKDKKVIYQKDVRMIPEANFWFLDCYAEGKWGTYEKSIWGALTPDVVAKIIKNNKL